MVAFSRIKPGDKLYAVHRTRMGNTNMSKLACLPVVVVSLDAEKRTAMCSCNNNKPRLYTESRLAKLRRSPPKDKQ